MKVTIIQDAENKIETELDFDNIKTLLCLLKMNYGHELTNSILTEEYAYILTNADRTEVIPLDQNMVQCNLPPDKELIIVKAVNGETGAEILVAVGAAASTAAVSASIGLSIAAFVINVVIAVAVSAAVSAIMNAISPTQEFSSDPSGKQKTSNLFNGGVLTREQGGSVPYLFGRCFTGGIVISAGVSSQDE